jgi:hypothetical protein
MRIGDYSRKSFSIRWIPACAGMTLSAALPVQALASALIAPKTLEHSPKRLARHPGEGRDPAQNYRAFPKTLSASSRRRPGSSPKL